MIEPVRKRLTAIFTAVIMVLNVLIMAFSFFVLHRSLIVGIKEHLTHDIKDEYIYVYRLYGLTSFQKVTDENHFQVLNKSGEIVAAVLNSVGFDSGLNKDLLSAAFSGQQGFEMKAIAGKRYLISYFPMDDTYVGRAAVSLAVEAEEERNFLEMLVILSPLMLLLSYFVSRYLLSHAMKPISDIFIFQETFLSNINHELQSPLASMKGNSEVALRKERSAGEYREVIESGLKETDRIINLLHNLSLLASSKFKPLDLYKKSADLDEILRDLLLAYDPVLDAKQISLDISETAGMSCLCDKDLIRRTMENLLDNAVKYTPNGGSIKASLSRKKGRIFFTISNTCEPIEKKELENLFEPFYRGEKSHTQAEGKGLGLYIVNYIVRSHGGNIALDKTDSRVFSVTVSLPAQT
jgi:signal transduction histidine kinase